MLKLALLSAILLATAANAAQPLKVCYVSSLLDNILPRATDKRKENGGFLLRIEQFQKQYPNKPIAFTAYRPTNKTDDILSLIQKADHDGCDLLVGIVTSRDALLSGPYLTKNHLFGMSSTALADDIDHYYPYLLTACTSSTSWASEVVRFVKREKPSKVLVLSKPTELFSIILTDKLMAGLSTAKVADIDAEDNAPADVLEILSKSEKTFIISTTYPIQSIPTLQKIAMLGLKNAKIIGNPSWMESQTFKSLPEIMKRIPKILLITPWTPSVENAAFKKFKEAYQQKYGSAPDHDTSYDYDVMTMITDCYQKSQSKASTRAQIQQCMRQPRVFSGVTGEYRFDGKASHPIRHEHVIDSGYSK